MQRAQEVSNLGEAIFAIEVKEDILTDLTDICVGMLQRVRQHLLHKLVRILDLLLPIL
jgi:hypothetical protein